MQCPKCDSPATEVVDSRKRARVVIRRRECTKCHKRFTTTETYRGQGYSDLNALSVNLELAAAQARRIGAGRFISAK